MRIGVAAVGAALVLSVGSATGASAREAGPSGVGDRAHSAEPCRYSVFRVNVDTLNIWEERDYDERNSPPWASVGRGTQLSGPARQTSEGWTPVTSWRYKSGDRFISILVGANDTRDYVRGSGLDWLYCY
ncbi:MAG: hypothetical protein ACRCYR_16750 [Phycicoccus sp.]